MNINAPTPRAIDRLTELRALILEAAPGAEELVNYGIEAFALKAGGKRDTQIMIAAHRNHVGFYPSPVVIEHFMAELEGYKHSKGAIQFPIDEPLPRDLIVRMVHYKQQLVDAE